MEKFAAYRSAPEIARYQSWETPYTVEQAAGFLEQMKLARAGSPRTWFQLAVELQNQAGLIGDCAFQILAEESRQAQIGFTFSRLYQRQGRPTPESSAAERQRQTSQLGTALERELLTELQRRTD